MDDFDASSLFKELKENLQLHPTEKNYSCSLVPLKEPYIQIVNNEIFAFPIQEGSGHEYILGFWVANLGESDLAIDEFSPSELISEFEILQCPTFFYNDGQYQLVLLYAKTIEDIKKGSTLFILNSNATNIPYHSLIYFGNPNKKNSPLFWNNEYNIPLFQKSRKHRLELNVNLNSLPYFADFQLELSNLTAYDVSLYGKSIDENDVHYWGRYNSTHGKISTKLSLDDGQHLFCYKNKDLSFSGLSNGSSLKFENKQIYTVLDLHRYEVKLKLVNCFDNKLSIKIELSEQWLSCSRRKISIEKDENDDLQFKINRQFLNIGKNICNVIIKNRSNNSEICRINFHIEIKRPLSVVFPLNPVDKGSIQIKSKLWGDIWKLPLELRCFGKRRFFVTVYNIVEGNHDIISFDHESESYSNIKREIEIDTSALTSSQTHLPLVIDTGCYLANKRFCEATLFLQEPHNLIWKPKYFHFRFNNNNSQLERYIYFNRSDNVPVEINIAIADELAKYLKLTKISSHCWCLSTNSNFEFPKKNSNITDEIVFHDLKSNIKNTIPIRLDFSV